MKRYSNLLFQLTTLFVGILIAYSLYLTFMVVPDEKVMGAVQRIFYFHVGSAFATYLALAVVLLGALGYLATEKPSFDALQESAAEVSLLFASIVLFSGMIWGYSAWGTAFRFEPRLVTSLILWLILIGLHILRRFGDGGRLPTHCAVLGILSVLTVPVVIYSINLLPQFQQLHPQVVERGGLVDPLMKQAFYTTSTHGPYSPSHMGKVQIRFSRERTSRVGTGITALMNTLPDIAAPNTYPGLFWGYLVVWGLITLYIISLGVRCSRLESDENSEDQ